MRRTGLHRILVAGVAIAMHPGIAGADPSNVAPAPIAGLLSPEAIRRVVLANLGQVARCHEAALARHPNLEGRVTIRFAIGGSGAVLSSAPTQNTTGDADVANCIATAVSRWRFPPPQGGGVVTVNYPFNLQRAE